MLAAAAIALLHCSAAAFADALAAAAAIAAVTAVATAAATAAATAVALPSGPTHGLAQDHF